MCKNMRFLEDYFALLVVEEEEASKQVFGIPKVSILKMNYPIEEVGVDMDKKEEKHCGEDKNMDW